MTSTPFEPQLTEAASAALEEYLSDIREEVLRRARENASESTSGLALEVTVRDVVAGAEQALHEGRSTPRRDFRGRVLRAYSLVFAGIAFIGGLLWIGPDLTSLDGQELIGLVSALTGLLGVIASRAALEMTRSRPGRVSGGARGGDDRHRLAGQFLSQYTDLELSFRDFNARTLGESVIGRNPTSTALHSGVLDNRTVEELRRVVDVRNGLVHGKKVSDEELHDGLATMQRMQDRIEHR